MTERVEKNWPIQSRNRVNEALKTGRAYFDDKDVLMLDGEGIWFPAGNALEWQLARGDISQAFYETSQRLSDSLKGEDTKPYKPKSIF